MGTLTISLTSTPATGSKSYTISDADVQSLLNWAQANYPVAPPDTRTNQQILLAYVQGWINATKNSVQQFQTTPPSVPPPITFT